MVLHHCECVLGRKKVELGEKCRVEPLRVQWWRYTRVLSNAEARTCPYAEAFTCPYAEACACSHTETSSRPHSFRWLQVLRADQQQRPGRDGLPHPLQQGCVVL